MSTRSCSDCPVYHCYYASSYFNCVVQIIIISASFYAFIVVCVCSVWTPGPENTGWKKAYLSQGFSFLQDMVERALAEEIVGHPIPTPGLYLQQMPYPCYQHDK